MIYIFDFDGTLVDSMPFWAGVHVDSLKSYGISVPDGFVEKITPLGNNLACEYDVSLGVKEDIDEYKRKINKIYEEGYYKNVIPKQYVPETLKKLKAEGNSLNVLTASLHSYVDPCLKKNNIYDIFDNVWTVEDFSNHSKSEKIIYEMAAKRLNAEINSCYFADDNILAIKTAKAAGMKTIAVYDSSSDSVMEEMKTIADKYIYSFKEL